MAVVDDDTNQYEDNNDSGDIDDSDNGMKVRW